MYLNMNELVSLTKNEDMLRENENYIWHYTSASTFAKLMESNSILYATMTSFLNDSYEYLYANEQLEDFLLDLFKSKTFLQDIPKKQISQLKKDYNEAFKNLLEKFDIFVTCFCKSPDDLSLWRAYTKEGGFSIGFDRTELVAQLIKLTQDSKGNTFYVSLEHNEKEEITKELPLFSKKGEGVKFIYDCIYDKEKQKAFFAALLKGNQLGDLSDTPTTCMGLVSALFKEPSFREEKEVRLVLNIPNDKAHRKQIKYIGGKPRLETGIRNVSEFIKGVYISPNGDREHNYKLAQLFSSQCDNEFPVYKSKSSYNGY